MFEKLIGRKIFAHPENEISLKRRLYLRKFHYFFKMNDKRTNFILLITFDRTQQDNGDARDDIDKFLAKISNEEGIYFDQVFYILFFDAVFISNK